MESGIPVEVWRYYLLSIRPESSDSQFTWPGLISANNFELLANLGNFVNRVVKFANAKYDSIVPPSSPSQDEQKLKDDVNTLLKDYNESLEVVKIRQGLRIFMELSSRGNLYLQDNKIDNSLFANQKERCDTVINTALNLAYLLSALVYPYMPTTSLCITEQLRCPPRKITELWDAKDLPAGHKIGKAQYLFKRIEEERIEELRAKYSGSGAPAPAKVKRSKPAAAVMRKATTAEELLLEDQITAQGELVRKLKTEKAAAGDVKKEVDVLLELKKQLAVLLKV